MLDFQQKRNIRKIIFSKLMLLVLLLLVVFVGKGVWRVYKSQVMSRDNLANVERKYEDLLDRKEMLEDSIKSLNTEEGIEEEIRQKFGVVKDGETMIVIIDNKNTSSKAVEMEDGGFWSKIVEWFK